MLLSKQTTCSNGASMSRAERESYNYIEQTCPIVNSLERKCLELIQEDLENELSYLSAPLINGICDKVHFRVETLVGKIKEQVTEKFRGVLIDMIHEKQDLEVELDDLNKQVSSLEGKLDESNIDLEYYINQLREK